MSRRHIRVRPGYWTQMTLKGSRRIAQGASPGKKHASSHPGNHPRSDPEEVEQDGRRATSGSIDAQDASLEMPKRPAPPFQGGHPDLTRFPGLAPWAVLPDPCGVLFDSLTWRVSRQPARSSAHSVTCVPQPALCGAGQSHSFRPRSLTQATVRPPQGKSA